MGARLVSVEAAADRSAAPFLIATVARCPDSCGGCVRGWLPSTLQRGLAAPPAFPRASSPVGPWALW